jgi:hypothetical protein
MASGKVLPLQQEYEPSHCASMKNLRVLCILYTFYISFLQTLKNSQLTPIIGDGIFIQMSLKL